MSENRTEDIRVGDIATGLKDADPTTNLNVVNDHLGGVVDASVANINPRVESGVLEAILAGHPVARERWKKKQHTVRVPGEGKPARSAHGSSHSLPPFVHWKVPMFLMSFGAVDGDGAVATAATAAAGVAPDDSVAGWSASYNFLRAPSVSPRSLRSSRVSVRAALRSTSSCLNLTAYCPRLREERSCSSDSMPTDDVANDHARSLRPLTGGTG